MFCVLAIGIAEKQHRKQWKDGDITRHKAAAIFSDASNGKMDISKDIRLQLSSVMQAMERWRCHKT